MLTPQQLKKRQTFQALTPQQRVARANLRRNATAPYTVTPEAPSTPPKVKPVSFGEGIKRKRGEQALGQTFTNRTTGQVTDKYGVAQTDGAAETQDDNRSIEDRAKSYAEGQMQQNTNTAADLGLPEDTPYYTSLEQETRDQIDALKARRAQQEASYDYQQQASEYQTGQAKNYLESQSQAQAAQLTGGGNGPTSFSNMDLAGKIKSFNQQKIDQALAAQNDTKAQLDQARANLKLAEKQNNTALIQQYQQELDNAQMAVEQADTDYYNSLTQAQTAQTDAQKTQIAGLQAFQGFVDQGQELSTDTIMGMSQQLGIPMETLYGYYQGVQNIRDDKSLDEQTKQVALDQAKQDLNDQVMGMNTQAAAAVRGLTTLRASGASEDVIAAYKQAAGITDYDDPLTQAKLALDQANAKIAYNNANGIITSPLDLIDLAQKTYDYYQSMGYQAGAVPTGGEYGATSYTLENGLPAIMVNVQQGQSLDIPETRDRDEGQCGAFVNDYFGEKMMGNLFTQKMGLVDKSIQVPEPGMAFVMETESPYGHTGIVEYVDPSRGVMGIVDANWNNDGKVRRTEIPISDAAGFVRAPNAIPADASLTLNDVDKDLRSSVVSQLSQYRDEPSVKNFQTVQTIYNKANSVPDDNTNPQNDQLLVYAFAKAMDPSSAVREGEYDTIQSYAQTALERFGVNATRFYSNAPFLTPEARANIKASIAAAYESEKTSYTQTKKSFADTINHIAGINIADQLLQDYITPTDTAETDDPLGIGATSDQYDPLGLLD
jgi:hypothetical protein